MVRRRAVGVATLLGWLVSPAPARAHETGAVLDVLVAHDGQPTVLLTSYGVVRSEDDALRFECPSRAAHAIDEALRVGAPFRARVAASDALTIVARDGAIAISRDGGCSYQKVAVDGRAYAVAAHDAIAYALVEDDAGATLLAIDAEPRALHRFDVPPTEVAVIDGELVVSSAEERAVFRGDDMARTAIDGDVEWLTARAHTSSGGLALHRTAGGTTELVVLGDDLAPLNASALHGPVRVDDAWLAIADEQLASLRDGDDRWTLGDPTTMRCLVNRGDAAFACMQGDLVRIDRMDRGVSARTTELASLIALEGPTSCPPAAREIEAACELEWQHVAIELGIDPNVDPPGDEPAIAPPAMHQASCSTVPAPGTRGAWLLPLMLAMLAIATKIARRSTR